MKSFGLRRRLSIAAVLLAGACSGGPSGKPTDGGAGGSTGGVDGASAAAETGGKAGGDAGGEAGDAVPPPYTLTIDTPTGGKVTDDEGNINCGTSCTHGGYASGAQVTLTAQANSGYQLTGWSGGGCGGSSPTCVVKLTSNVTITATFRQVRVVTVKIVDTNGCGGNYFSSVSVTGNGGARCSITDTASTTPGATCAWSYLDGQITSVSATTIGATVFDGTALNCGTDSTETGSCLPGKSGTCTCTFTLTAPRTVVVSMCHP